MNCQDVEVPVSGTQGPCPENEQKFECPVCHCLDDQKCPECGQCKRCGKLVPFKLIPVVPYPPAPLPVYPEPYTVPQNPYFGDWPPSEYTTITCNNDWSSSGRNTM